MVLHLDHDSPWVYGVLVNNVWSLSSNERGGSYNDGLIQPFVNYNFKEGFYLTSAPIAARSTGMPPVASSGPSRWVAASARSFTSASCR